MPICGAFHVALAPVALLVIALLVIAHVHSFDRPITHAPRVHTESLLQLRWRAHVAIALELASPKSPRAVSLPHSASDVEATMTVIEVLMEIGITTSRCSTPIALGGLLLSIADWVVVTLAAINAWVIATGRSILSLWTSSILLAIAAAPCAEVVLGLLHSTHVIFAVVSL